MLLTRNPLEENEIFLTLFRKKKQGSRTSWNKVPSNSLSEERSEAMIVTDKFVFVHLPRSGGTFVSEVIRKFFPSAHEIGYHLPRTLLPAEYSHLPVLGAVRNPWDFYVS